VYSFFVIKIKFLKFIHSEIQTSQGTKKPPRGG